MAVCGYWCIPQHNTCSARQASRSAKRRGTVDSFCKLRSGCYAIGDASRYSISFQNKKVLAPLGDLANLQGRVAGENAVLGNSVTFPGTIQTGICKVFDYAAGSTGLSEKAALQAGFIAIETAINASPDKPGFMKGKMLVTKLVVEKSSGRILGAQCVGPGDVSKQLAQWAMAIKGRLTVEDIFNADTALMPRRSHSQSTMVLQRLISWKTS